MKADHSSAGAHTGPVGPACHAHDMRTRRRPCLRESFPASARCVMWFGLSVVREGTQCLTWRPGGSPWHVCLHDTQSFFCILFFSQLFVCHKPLPGYTVAAWISSVLRKLHSRCKGNAHVWCECCSSSVAHTPNPSRPPKPRRWLGLSVAHTQSQRERVCGNLQRLHFVSDPGLLTCGPTAEHACCPFA